MLGLSIEIAPSDTKAYYIKPQMLVSQYTEYTQITMLKTTEYTTLEVMNYTSLLQMTLHEYI